MFDINNISKSDSGTILGEYIPPDHLGFKKEELSNIDKVKQEISALELDKWNLIREIKEKDEEIYKLKNEIDKLKSEISYLKAISN